MLHRLRAGARADRLEQRFARGAIVAKYAYLDHLVAAETAIYFREHACGETGAAHDHHGFERVRARLERAAFGRGQCCGNVIHRVDSR